MKWSGKTSTPADDTTRRARRAAHAAFDPLWKDGSISRSEAYIGLAEFLGYSRRNTHIGYFNFEECQKVVAYANEMRPKVGLD